MSPLVVVALVLLPAVMYLLALALAATRMWLGITALPRARHALRAVRRTGWAGGSGGPSTGPGGPPTGYTDPREGE